MARPSDIRSLQRVGRGVKLGGHLGRIGGEGNGLFKAYDARNGTLLWQFQCGAGANAPPISYVVNGKQHIAVAAGGNAQMNFKRGDSVFAFSLD